MSIQKIVLLGAECTGKSTLAMALAHHFQTRFVPEYMRTYLQNKPAQYICQYDDLVPIACGQIHSENMAYTQAVRYLFCDTSLILLKVYSEYYFGACPDFITQTIPKLHYDYILLTDNIGISWQPDEQRDLPHGHNIIRQNIIKQLEYYQLPYHTVSGTTQQRLQQVQHILSNSTQNTLM